MNTILDSAHTWFFDGLRHVAPDELIVGLVEGLKAQEAEMVRVADETSLGPYFPVEAGQASRYVSVKFSGVLAYQVVDESYGAPITDIVGDEGVLRQCTDMSYLTYLLGDSLIGQMHDGNCSAYFLWTEDQTIFVVSVGEVSVALESRPDSEGAPRNKTYYAG